MKFEARPASRLKFLSALAVVLSLSGCVNFRANYIDPKYGEIAADAVPVRADANPVAMPSNAPSISQGFNPAPDEKEQRSYPQDHAGIDIVADPGTPILAAGNGTVVKSLFEPLFGHQLSILLTATVNGD